MSPLSYGALEDPKLTPSSQLVIAPPLTSSPAAEGAPVGDDAEGDADPMDPTTICTPDIDFMERRQFKKEATLDKTAVEITDADMVSITWHTRNTWEYTGKKGGFGRKGYVACTAGYKCTMHNACIGGLGNTSSLPIVMINVVFEHTPFWALGVYGRILKAPIPQYTAVYSGVYGRILRVYGRILGVFVCTTWLFQVEKFHCCAFCAHLVACFAFAQQMHTT